MDQNKLENSSSIGNTRPPYLSPGKPVCRSRTGHGTMDWLKVGKVVHQGCILSPCLFTYMQRTSCKMLDWMKHKLESRFPGEISITSDMQMTLPLWQKEKRNYEPLDEGEKGQWKSWLKTQHSKNKDHGMVLSLHSKEKEKQWKQWQTLFSWAPKPL